MDGKLIEIKPLESNKIAHLADVIELSDQPSFLINKGMCGRHHDLAKLEFTGKDARPIIRIAESKFFELPWELNFMERHPLGSQAFIPTSDQPFLIVVAEDKNGSPDKPMAFITNGVQGINYHRNTWHGILYPLKLDQNFIIFDRDGAGSNLEEHFFENPYRLSLS